MITVEVGAVDAERAVVTINLSPTSRLVIHVQQQQASRRDPKGWRKFTVHSRWGRRPTSRHLWSGESVESLLLGYVLLDDTDGTMRPGPQYGDDEQEAPPFASTGTHLTEGSR